MRHHFKYAFAVLFCCLLLPLLSGCDRVKEINDMAIVSGMSVDLTSQGAYHVSAEIVNKVSAEDTSQSKGVISAYGSTLGDAFENCNFQDSRQIYFSHARTLVLSRELAASSGIEAVLDYVMRNYKMRLSTNLLIADLPKASSIAALSSPPTGLIYFDLDEMIKTDRRYGACVPTKVYQAVNILSQPETCLTVPLVGIRKDRAILKGTAVFHGSKLVETLTQEETLYLLLLQNRLNTAHLTLPDSDLTFRIEKANTTCHTTKDGAKLIVDIQLYCTISQAGAATPREGILSFAEELRTAVVQSCDALIQKAKRVDADIFSFNKAMVEANHRFSTLSTEVNCKVTINPGEVNGWN